MLVVRVLVLVNIITYVPTNVKCMFSNLSNKIYRKTHLVSYADMGFSWKVLKIQSKLIAPNVLSKQYLKI
jgi:hypothetical protein